MHSDYSYRVLSLTVLLAMLVILLAGPASAEVPQIMSYQGYLTDTDGNPVADSSYEIYFSIWEDSTGGQLLWLELDTVETNSGRFSVNLGTINPLGPNIFNPGIPGESTDDLRYLQIQVVGDSPISPRTRLGTTPNSFITSRIRGDIVSGPGKLIVVNEGLIGTLPFFEVHADSEGVMVQLADPRPTPLFPGITIAGDSTGSRISMNEGLIGEYPFFEIHADATKVSLKIVNEGLIDTLPLLEILADQSGTIIKLASPDDGGLIDPWPTTPLSHPILFLMADNQGPKMVFGNTETQNEIVSIGADGSGGHMRLYDPEGSIIVELSSNGDLLAERATFGNSNTNSGTTAFVAGTGNSVTGDWATIPGGRSNIAQGNYSFAAGRNAQANHDGSFVWADASGATVTTTTGNQFLCRAIGGTIFYTTPNNSTGVQLNYGSSQWQVLSDRNAKRNIRPVDGKEILEKLERMPISRWSYKAQDESIEHIGPMAQDLNTLFSIGEDDRHISTLDPSGVALAAAKELAQQNRELKKIIGQLEDRIAKLERKL